MFLTVILFIVRVPVLSEQISVELPKVSKLSNFFTKTFLSPNRVAIILSVLVTVAGNPYGTLATITIMNPSIKAKIIGAPYDKPIRKKIVPIITDKIVKNLTKCNISILRVLSPIYKNADLLLEQLSFLQYFQLKCYRQLQKQCHKLNLPYKDMN